MATSEIERKSQNPLQGVQDFLDATTTSSAYKENILHEYNVFNYVITFGAISYDELKNPDATYRRNMDFIILQSSGKPYSATSATSKDPFVQKYSSSLGETKKYNYYLQDLTIKTTGITSSKDAMNLEMTMNVIEPYGIDGFVKMLTAGVGVKGHGSLNRNACFMLKIHFVGYRPGSDDPVVIPNSERYIPCCFQDMQASVTQDGTKFTLNLIPFNNLSRLDVSNKVEEGITAKGNTAKEIINSYIDQLNKKLKEKYTDDKNWVMSTYKVEFADYDASGKLIKDTYHKLYDSPYTSTNKMQTSANTGMVDNVTGAKAAIASTNLGDKTEVQAPEYPFPDTAYVDKVLEEILLNSEYVRSLINEMEKNTSGGLFEYFKIQRTPPIPKDKDPVTNRQIFEYVYRITPWKLHYKRGQIGTFAPTGLADAEKNIVRTYDWLYTGKNKDIINLNFNFDAMVVYSFNFNLGSKAAPDTKNSVAATDMNTFKAPEWNTGIQDAWNRSGWAKVLGFGTTVENVTNANASKTTGGMSSLTNDPTVELAKDFHKAINNYQEMLNLEMEILGDPLWLGSQGLELRGEKLSPKNNKVMSDGSMAYNTYEPYFKLVTESVTDFDENGDLVNTTGGPSDWTGIYRVFEVDHKFSNGVFTQSIRAGKMNVGVPSSTDTTKK